MRLVLIGMPGAGKGTQGTILSTELGIPHISTGDLFRAHVTSRTPLGRLAQQYLDSGALVPDHVTNDMVRQRLTESDAQEGFLLDGFPRNIAQAEVLSQLLAANEHALDAVLEFDAPDDVVATRLLSRGRPDDIAEVIRHRLQVYRTKTAPLLSYYADILLTVHAVGSVEEITKRVLQALKAGLEGDGLEVPVAVRQGQAR